MHNYASFFKGRNADLATLAASLQQLDGTRHKLLAMINKGKLSNPYPQKTIGIFKGLVP